MSFKNQLKNARLNAGMTQQQVADETGIDKTTYSGYETGKREPDVCKIKAFAKLFGVSGDELLETGFTSKVEKNVLNEEEQNLIKKYRSLDQSGKASVDSILDIQYKRCIGADKEGAEFSEEIC